MKTKKETHQSVERALKILLAFTPHNNPLGTKQVSELFGLHMSTTSRLLKVLKENNYLQVDPKTREYSLGRSVAKLSEALVQSMKTELLVIAKPFIDELCLKVKDTVSMEVLSGSSTVLAYTIEGPEFIRIKFTLGNRLPIHVAAGAKAILAFSEPNIVDRLIPAKLEKYTDKTITDPSVLKKELEEIRRTGIAHDRGERDLDIHAIAAPIFNCNRKPVAAVIIGTLTDRMKRHIESGVPETLKITAAKISEKLLNTN